MIELIVNMKSYQTNLQGTCNTKNPAKPPQCKYVELNGLRVLLILSLFERVCRYA